MRQQGDVLLKKLNQLPKGIKPKELDNGHIVLAYGEVTGHAHRIKDTANSMFYEKNGKSYLVVKKPVDLTHEEHHAQSIPTGIYEIGIVREYDYLKDMERAVID